MRHPLVHLLHYPSWRLLAGVALLLGCDSKPPVAYGLDGSTPDSKVVPDRRGDGATPPPDATLRDGCVPQPERCDGVDDDCDGHVDEHVFTVGEACETDASGPCRPGRTACVEGALVCIADVEPAVETCDGRDEDCDGLTDEGATLGDPCDTGLLGVCALGREACGNGETICVREASEMAETCNGLDDDCDGIGDELNPGGGAECDTGRPGRCAVGQEACLAGALVCATGAVSADEVCNGDDDDCDGAIDEGDPGDRAPCTTNLPGVCADGVTGCRDGGVRCVAAETPGDERCNNLDDDCDGDIDEMNPNGGGECVPEAGCGWGTLSCRDGAFFCEPESLGSEVCNAFDDDCDRRVDEGNPEGGADCVPDDGCGVGIVLCRAAELVCRRLVAVEICSGQDDDCDGLVDEGNPGGDVECVPEDGCGVGRTVCRAGAMVCARGVMPPEICNGLDEDCDGIIDELPQPPCETGEHGPCNEGLEMCREGVLACVRTVAPACEGENEVDDDCDGVVDELPDPVCDPPELRVEEFCVDDSDNDLGLAFALDWDDVVHLSRVQRISGNLLYTAIDTAGVVINERVAARVSAIAIDEVDDTDILLTPQGPAICFRDVRQRRLDVALRRGDEWVRETVENNPGAGRDCTLGWADGRLIMAFRTDDVLKFAARDGENQWAVEVVDAPARSAAGHGAQLTIHDGQLVIVHQDPDLGALRVSWVAGDDWRTAIHRQGGTPVGYRPAALSWGTSLRVLHGATPDDPDRGSDGGLFVTDVVFSPIGFQTRRMAQDFVGGGQAVLAYDDRTVVLTRLRQRSALFGERDALVVYSDPDTGRYAYLVDHGAQAQRHGYLRLSVAPGMFGLPIFVYADQRSPFGDDRGSSKVCVARPADSDGDRLPDGLELQLGTDPDVPDSDGDGVSDGEEVLDNGTDPLDGPGADP